MKYMKKISFGFIFSVLILGIIVPLFSPSILVMAQTSIIEVNVLEFGTSNPIEGVTVELYDSMYMDLDEGITDVAGFCEFTSLDAGDYFVFVDPPGYLNVPEEYVVIATDGDTEIVNFYLTLAYTPGDGFIDVYVYDSGTTNPIVGAEVELYCMGEDITSGVTDGTGFYNLTGLGAGDYYVFADATDYEADSSTVTIDYDGEGKLAVFNLDLIFIPGNGFIDVFVYDPSTLTPIVGADVELRNFNSYLITTGVTDGTGFYNFTGLGAATYSVWAEATDYYANESSVTIDYDGEGEYLMLYIAPYYIPGSSSIGVYVYDNNTLNPIANAAVRLYTEYYGWVDMGNTNMAGYYEFSGLGAAKYIVEGQMNHYETNSSLVTIVSDGDTESLDLFLPPIVHTIDILSPSDSDTIEGGLVLVNCDANDEWFLDYIEVYVNAILIITFVIDGGPPFQSEFFVPVFGNGTNTIELVAYWLDVTSDSDSVEINSINVIPVVRLKEGDILNYKYDLLTSTQEADYNFTFTNWLSPFEMNTAVILHMWDDTGVLMHSEHNIVINVLNGYVSVDPTTQFLYRHFFPFIGLLPNPQIGDKTVLTMWHEILTVNGSISWSYTDMWTLEYLGGPIVIYVEQSSNILYYQELPGQMEVTLTETTIDFLNPEVSDLADFSYTEGDTGNIISWNATDMYPGTYTIYRNTIEIETDTWTSDTNITINVDNLSPGAYVFRLVVTDAAGNSVEDTLTVTVNAIVVEINPILSLLLLPMSIIVTYVILRKRRN
ncbi:MAG: MSCRAMM family protein [Candidatus Heimdallarchaeaceae archaeon]